MAVQDSWGMNRVYYQDDRGQYASIPASWTDAVPVDPVVAMSAGRAPFRLQDLLELARLTAALGQEVSRAH